MDTYLSSPSRYVPLNQTWEQRRYQVNQAALKVTCPHCGAKQQRQCRTRNGDLSRNLHLKRSHLGVWLKDAYIMAEEPSWDS
jgi:hypothetical protein